MFVARVKEKEHELKDAEKNVSCSPFSSFYPISSFQKRKFELTASFQLHAKFDLLKKQHAEEKKRLEESKRHLDESINNFSKHKVALQQMQTSHTLTLGKKKK